MKTQTKHILLISGGAIIAYWAYHRFIKKDKYTGSFLNADGATSSAMLKSNGIWDSRSEGARRANDNGRRSKMHARMHAAMGSNGAIMNSGEPISAPMVTPSANNPAGGVAIPNQGRPNRNLMDWMAPTPALTIQKQNSMGNASGALANSGW